MRDIAASGALMASDLQAALVGFGSNCLWNPQRMGGHTTVGEVKQNAKGETWKVIIQWSAHTITAETCEKYEVRK